MTGSVLIAALLMLTSPPLADTSAPVDFVDNEIADIVLATADLFEERYVDETRGRLMAHRLRDGLKSGAFDTAETRGEFAALVQKELRSVYDDKHIQIDFKLAPEESGEEPAVTRRPARTGIREVQMLEGGVGYMRIKTFAEGDVDSGLLDGAVRCLAACDAVIVDVRGNGGGSSRAADALMTSFLGSESVRLGTMRSRMNAREMWTEPVTGQAYVDSVSLFVLIDGETASAAEAVAYHLKHVGRATVFGTRSVGAANISGTVGLEVWDDAEENLIGTYVLILPRAQPINIVTGASWEGIGVEPDVETDDALADAHAMAIRQAHTTAPWVDDLVAEVQASYAPVSVSADQLAILAGNYENGRSYFVENGHLFTRNASGDVMELVPVTATMFRYKSGVSARVEFDLRADGTVEAARIVFSDGGYERFGRVD